MIRLIRHRLITSFAVAISFLSCGDEKEEKPVISNIPAIELEGVSFGVRSTTSVADTLILDIRIKDGDFDLGLDPLEREFPYHELSFAVDNNGQRSELIPDYQEIDGRNVYILEHNAPGSLVSFRHMKIFTDLDPVLDCNFYLSTRSEDVVVKGTSLGQTPTGELTAAGSDTYLLRDSLLITRNPDFYNIEVDFLVEASDGTFQKFGWSQWMCEEPFYGRYPLVRPTVPGQLVFSGPFFFARISETEGYLSYRMISIGFQPLFTGKNLKLRVSIKDRALNTSNVIETPVFTF